MGLFISPKIEDSNKAVTIYLDTSINHLPNSFLILQIYNLLFNSILFNSFFSVFCVLCIRPGLEPAKYRLHYTTCAPALPGHKTALVRMVCPIHAIAPGQVDGGRSSIHHLYTAIGVVRRGLCRCYGLSVYRSFGHPFWSSKRAKNGKNAYTRSGALLVRSCLSCRGFLSHSGGIILIIWA